MGETFVPSDFRDIGAPRTEGLQWSSPDVVADHIRTSRVSPRPPHSAPSTPTQAPTKLRHACGHLVGPPASEMPRCPEPSRLLQVAPTAAAQPSVLKTPRGEGSAHPCAPLSLPRGKRANKWGQGSRMSSRIAERSPPSKCLTRAFQTVVFRPLKKPPLGTMRGALSYSTVTHHVEWLCGGCWHRRTLCLMIV